MESTIGSMVSLGIKTWGARASFLVDPISLSVRYGTYSIGIRESSLAVNMDLRSQGEYVTTVSGLPTASKTPLLPVIAIPVSAEVIFDVGVSNFFISPILTVSSDNAIDGIAIDFDVELDTFIEKFDLEVILANFTNLLNEIAKYGPNLTVGNAPSALTGLFDVMNDAKEFGNALQEFMSIVVEGESYCYVHPLPSLVSYALLSYF